MPNILERWGITAEELTEIVDKNPSLRGFMLGYVGEYQLKKRYFSDERVSEVSKFDDHDRTNKNDLSVIYKGVRLTFEVKSLQTKTVKMVGDKFVGKFQCDASDSREIVLPNNDKVKTTSLLVGEFDILAVNLFAFTGKWDFEFAHNKDLPRSTWKGYTEEQRKYLLATMMPISWPLPEPYTIDPFVLLDHLVAERTAR